jgi:hypothetical protein
LVSVSSAAASAGTLASTASSAAASIATAYMKSFVLITGAAPVVAANTPFQVNLTSALKDGDASNVVYVKINGISLNYSSSDGWQVSGNAIAIRIPYAVDAIDVIEINYVRAN